MTETLSAGAVQRQLELLRRVWGYQEFLPLQREAIDATLGGRDSLLVLPTGGGKSLCYQLPALLGEGLAVVVSPLISLMKDQVDSLTQRGVAAAVYNSSLDADERRAVRDAAAAGRLRLLYLAPERLDAEAGGGFLELLGRAGVAYFAIDEAHCISQWGHAFRPDYRRLAALRERFPEASMHAYTATATPRVRRDIVEQLALREPEVLVGSFDRPNLIYRVLRRHDLAAKLRRVLDRHRGEAGIVYCISRREVDDRAARLAELGYSALPYHAGLDDETRRRNQEAFLEERTDIVVATVAFGMGIDRPDVRFVVHTGSPRSLEHYQQESGRAGRDGLPAECVLFYSPADFVTWRRLLESSGELTEGAGRLLSEMSRYAGATRCRHRALVEYFGQELVHEGGDGCGACDWCLGELERVDEPVVVAQKILSAVARMGQRWGVAQVVDVLRGRSTDKVVANGHHELSTFGLLESCPPDELRGYLDQLVDRGFLVIRGERYPILQMSPEGLALLKGETDLELFRQQRPPPRGSRRAVSKKERESSEGVDRELFEGLRELRRELAAERGVPPYVIFHVATLRDLARRKPATEAELLEIYGVGEKKARELGPAVLEVIQRQ